MDSDVHLSELARDRPHVDDRAAAGPRGSAFWIGRRTLAVGTGAEVTLIDVGRAGHGRRSPSAARSSPRPRPGAATSRSWRRRQARRPPARLGARLGRRRTVAVPGLRGGRAQAGPRRCGPRCRVSRSRPAARSRTSCRAGTASSPRTSPRAARASSPCAPAAPCRRPRRDSGRLAADERRGRTGTLVTTGGDLRGDEFASFLGGAPAGLRITDLGTRRTHLAVPERQSVPHLRGHRRRRRREAGDGRGGRRGARSQGTPAWSSSTGRGHARGLHARLRLPLDAGIRLRDARRPARARCSTSTAARPRP